jgi:hypothetical protein
VISLFAIGVLLNISRYRDTLAVEEEQRQSDQPPEPQAHARRPYALIERRQPAKVRRTFATRSRQVQPVRARAIARVRHG